MKIEYINSFSNHWYKETTHHKNVLKSWSSTLQIGNPNDNDTFWWENWCRTDSNKVALLMEGQWLTSQWDNWYCTFHGQIIQAFREIYNQLFDTPNQPTLKGKLTQPPTFIFSCYHNYEHFLSL